VLAFFISPTLWKIDQLKALSDKDELLKSIKAKKKEIAKANQSSQGIIGNAPVPQGSKLQMQALQAELKALRGKLKALGK